MIPRTQILMLVVLLLAGLLVGCTKNPPPSLYDPNYDRGVRPVVSNIAPSTGALGGVTILTITGQYFSPTPGNNLVFFNNTPATVTAATATQLQVTAPTLAKDSIAVKVAVVGSDYYSYAYYYNIGAATIDKFPNFTASQYPAAVECDAAGNMYASVVDGTTGIGVKKYDSSGAKTDYSPAFSTAVASWKGMKFGPGGALFVVASRNVIFRIPPGGGAAAVWASGSGLGVLTDLDFDANGNLWGSGTGGSIYRVRQDKSVKAFPFVGTIRTVRVYAGAVYVGGKRDSLEKVWKLPIIGNDSLDAEQEYFNISSIYGANTFGVYAVTFATDGDMFVGTDAADAILVVHPDKTSEPFYPGLIQKQTVSLSFGAGTDLFQGRSATPGPATVVKIHSQRTGAPYYGRTL